MDCTAAVTDKDAAQFLIDISEEMEMLDQDKPL